jgi:hypothetical protein
MPSLAHEIPLLAFFEESPANPVISIAALIQINKSSASLARIGRI